MKITVHPKEKFVGLFIVVALLLTLAVIYYNARSTFEEKFMYRVVLPKTYGLTLGDKVRLKGLAIGKVYSIDITTDKRTGKETIEVYLLIEQKKYINLIKRDATITIQPALGPIPAVIELNPGKEKETLPNKSDIKLLEQPTTSVEGIIGDVAQSIRNFKELSTQLKDEGLTSLLGPEIGNDLKSANASMKEIIAEFRDTANDVKSIVSDLKEGRRSVADLLFNDKTVIEVLAGAETQKRIDTLNTEKKGILELLLGPTVWTEIEAASQSWQPLRDSLLDLFTEGKVLLQRTQDMMTEVQPILEMVSENRENFNETILSIRQMLADVRELSETFAKEKKQIPILFRQVRELLDKSNQIAEEAKNHWLLAAFSKPKPATALTPAKSLRPNHYGE